jgi:hypothetical protein
MLGEAGGSSRRLLPVLTASTMAAWRCLSAAGAYRVGSHRSEGGFAGICCLLDQLFTSAASRGEQAHPMHEDCIAEPDDSDKKIYHAAAKFSVSNRSRVLKTSRYWSKTGDR